MFGNAPKALWQRWVEVDEQNRIPLACRALLLEESDRTLLFEAGIGAFFEPKLRARFGVQEENHVLLDNLKKLGVEPTDVDVVVLSHLHFDHAGGLLSAYEPNREFELVFPNAEFLVSKAAWERACNPHVRDRASFIPQLQNLLEASGRLRLVDASSEAPLGKGYRFVFSEGHTPGLLLVEIELDDGNIVFGGDLIPGMAWLHAPITMGYDRYPERLIDEKTSLLARLAETRGRLFFTHDPKVAMARVIRDGVRFRGVDIVENPIRLQISGGTP